MELQTSRSWTGPVGRELEYYWDIDQAASFLGISRVELGILRSAVACPPTCCDMRASIAGSSSPASWLD